MNQNNEKTAVITGASGTLCSVLAKSLGEMGYQVALIGRSIEKLEKVSEEIQGKGGKALPISADVAHNSAMRAAHDQVMETFGTCSVLINGAGGNQMEAVTTTDAFTDRELEGPSEGERGFFNLHPDSLKSVLEINTLGTIIPCQVFGAEMAKHKQGCIINFSSMNSTRPLSRVPAYAMAKAGIDNFTQWLAAYLAPANIRVNGIAPGFFLNERNRGRLTTEGGGLTQRGQNIIHHTPMGRFGEADELVGCMKWLLDDKASGFITGVTIPIDGGFLASAGV